MIAILNVATANLVAKSFNGQTNSLFQGHLSTGCPPRRLLLTKKAGTDWSPPKAELRSPAQLRSEIPNSLNFAIMSWALFAGFTVLSIYKILPSLPM